MKHISAEESLRPSVQTIVTCKEKAFSALVRTDLKSVYETDKEFGISNDYKKFLLNLSVTDPKGFIERVILLNLDKPLNSYFDGDKSILPTNERKKQKKVVGFTTEDTSIYFEDLAVDQYSKLIQILKNKTRLETLKTTLKSLENQEINRLSIGFFKSDFDGLITSNDKRNELIGGQSYKEISYYNYSKDGKYSKDTLEKMCRLVDKFEQINGSLICYVPEYNEATIFGEKGNQSLELFGIDDEPYVLKYAFSKAKKD